MKVEKWGDSLVVRLPESLVTSLDLKEGSCISIEVALDRGEISADQRQKTLAGLRALRRPFPPDFVFDRDEANSR